MAINFSCQSKASRADCRATKKTMGSTKPASTNPVAPWRLSKHCHAKQRVDMSGLSFPELSDSSSPILAQACREGEAILAAKLASFLADGGVARKTYFEVELRHVLIRMVKPHITGDQPFLTEDVNLKCPKVNRTSVQQKIRVGIGGHATGSRGLAASRIA